MIINRFHFLLLFLAYTSDFGIRFAKLNELHDLRKSVLHSFSDKEKIQNIKEIETEQDQSSKDKNLYSEFLRNYMNAIVKI